MLLTDPYDGPSRMAPDALTQETIGQRIRRLRDDTGLTQRELGHLLGHPWTHHRVTQWETDRNRPRVDDIPAVAAALHCSADYLLTGLPAA